MAAQTPCPVSANTETGSTKPFVYISAADAFRPVVPPRYIESKREAEFGILRKTADAPELGVRPLLMRPGTWAIHLSPKAGYPGTDPTKAQD
jgi:hypothetical protein